MKNLLRLSALLLALSCTACPRLRQAAESQTSKREPVIVCFWVVDEKTGVATHTCR